LTRRIILGLSIFFFIAYVYLAVIQPLFYLILRLPTFPPWLFIAGNTLVLFLFGLMHALYALGWRNALVFFGLTIVISWAFEHFGVATGRIFGSYHYTDLLGPKLGHVPILTLLSWCMLAYPAYIVANCMIGDHPTGSHGGPARIAWLSLMSAVVLTGLDLIIDPIMSGHVISAWVWEQGGSYFGVPARNFLGWMVTAFVIYFAYRIFEWRVGTRPFGPLTRSIVTMPLVIHGFTMMSALTALPGELKVIAPFVIGPPLLVAFTRVWFQADGHRFSIET
jgi:uncharacterized membrane protein